jgi:hypothetical protein
MTEAGMTEAGSAGADVERPADAASGQSPAGD